MSNDTDPYSKWDAAQTLMMDVTLSMLTDGATVDERLLSGLRDVATNAELDPAFRALTLTQPARSDVMQRLYNAANTPDPFAIYAAQETISHSLAEVLQNDLGTIYVENQVRTPFAPTAEQAGQRAMANMVLGLITRLDGGTEARKQFETADNMTSTLGALGMVYIGLPSMLLWKAKGRWSETEKKLNDEFWSAVDNETIVALVQNWEAFQ